MRSLCMTAAVFFLVMFLVACESDGGSDSLPDGDTDATDGDSTDGDSDQLAPLEVETASGAVLGVEENGLRVYRGVPYAAPPVGELRWQPPEPHPGWDDVFDASEYGPSCPQNGYDKEGANQSEDCLSLNIWTHTDTQLRPVMVWIHGGGFSLGKGSDEMYEGTHLASDGDVVVVSINYRLGALGFLALGLHGNEQGLPSSNYGIMDMIQALKWVQENIEAFGGDKSNVAIFGQSAGGVAVNSLLASPLASGLFHRAISHSGAGTHRYSALDEKNIFTANLSPLEYSEILLQATPCAAVGDSLSCLRNLDPYVFVDAVNDGPKSIFGLGAFMPVIDGWVLPKSPVDAIADGSINKVPLIVGSTLDEMDLWELTDLIEWPEDEVTYESMMGEFFGDAYEEIKSIYPPSDYDSFKVAMQTTLTEFIFNCSQIALAEKWANTGEPTYSYLFTHSLSGAYSFLGAFHALELIFLFGNPQRMESMTGLPYDFTEADNKVGEAMRLAWSTFAQNGAPESTPEWPAYSTDSSGVFVIKEEPEVSSDLFGGRCSQLLEAGLVL